MGHIKPSLHSLNSSLGWLFYSGFHTKLIFYFCQYKWEGRGINHCFLWYVFHILPSSELKKCWFQSNICYIAVGEVAEAFAHVDDADHTQTLPPVPGELPDAIPKHLGWVFTTVRSQQKLTELHSLGNAENWRFRLARKSKHWPVSVTLSLFRGMIVQLSQGHRSSALCSSASPWYLLCGVHSIAISCLSEKTRQLVGASATHHGEVKHIPDHPEQAWCSVPGWTGRRWLCDCGTEWTHENER